MTDNDELETDIKAAKPKGYGNKLNKPLLGFLESKYKVKEFLPIKKN
jgi:hypothetical protein